MAEEPKVAHQPPGEVFAWPKGWRLTALDEAILAVPAAILADTETVGSVIQCEDEVRLRLPTGAHTDPGARILIWLLAGQSVWLTKSCQAIVVPSGEGDKAARRFQLSQVGQ
jgi:hypothetical protein